MLFRPKISVETPRMVLRLPEYKDYKEWHRIRDEGGDFLLKWEPIRTDAYAGRRSFRQRVYWSARSTSEGRSLPLFLVQKQSGQFMGAITLDNIRRGPAQMANLGYWIGPEFARQGFMSEAVNGLVQYAFDTLDLSRIEAACLPKNEASRGLLERCGFKYEGVAQSYLQIGGRWRTHVLYANLRHDRRGRTDAE